jgi:hypothetical protein
MILFKIPVVFAICINKFIKCCVRMRKEKKKKGKKRKEISKLQKRDM